MKVFVYRKLYPRCSRREICPLRAPFYEILSREPRRLLGSRVGSAVGDTCGTICGHGGEAEINFEFIRSLFPTDAVRAAQIRYGATCETTNEKDDQAINRFLIASSLNIYIILRSEVNLLIALCYRIGMRTSLISREI